MSELLAIKIIYQFLDASKKTNKETVEKVPKSGHSGEESRFESETLGEKYDSGQASSDVAKPE